LEKTKFEESKPLTIDSTLSDLLKATIDNKSPKGVIRFTGATDNLRVAFVCIVSDQEGYMRAMEAYEQGRDEFALKVVNTVLDHVREHGVPKRNDELNLVLHS
jgi:hypothetical protein